MNFEHRRKAFILYFAGMFFFPSKNAFIFSIGASSFTKNWNFFSEESFKRRGKMNFLLVSFLMTTIFYHPEAK